MARRTRAELIAALKEAEEQKRQRRLALEAQEKQASRKLDTRRKIVTGAAVLAHAELHPSFAAALRDVLDQAVTKPTDRELLVDLIHPGATTNGTGFEPPGTASEPPAQDSITESSPEQSEHHQS